jgi:hypothetical protein
MANHVFLSYVRENSAQAERLASDLEALGIRVWVDRRNLTPGERWRDAIRNAIRAGDLFVACFSRDYSLRDRSHMNEELTLAIEELRIRPTHRAWFVPAILDDGEVPDRTIHAGESLRDLQWVSLAEDWENGVAQIAAAARRNRQAPPKAPPKPSSDAGRSSTLAGSVAPLSTTDQRRAILQLKNFVREARFPQHSWAKTFATIDPECRNLTREQVIDRIFSTSNHDDLAMYLGTAKRMYQFGPHEEALSREFDEICSAFGVVLTR